MPTRCDELRHEMQDVSSRRQQAVDQKGIALAAKASAVSLRTTAIVIRSTYVATRDTEIQYLDNFDTFHPPVYTQQTCEGRINTMRIFLDTSPPGSISQTERERLEGLITQYTRLKSDLYWIAFYDQQIAMYDSQILQYQSLADTWQYQIDQLNAEWILLNNEYTSLGCQPPMS